MSSAEFEYHMQLGMLQNNLSPLIEASLKQLLEAERRLEAVQRQVDRWHVYKVSLHRLMDEAEKYPDLKPLVDEIRGGVGNK